MNRGFLAASSLFFVTNIAVLAQPEPKEKPKANWFNLDQTLDGVMGVSTEKTYNTLLKNKPSKTVIVAVIDSGVEIDHEDLQENIWINTKEIPNNKIDDDKNGYIDDINGWDFLGNKFGEDIKSETLEITREYVKYKNLTENIDVAKATPEQKKQMDLYKKYKLDFESRKRKIEEQGGAQFLKFIEVYRESEKLIKQKYNLTEIDSEVLEGIKAKDTEDVKLERAKKTLERAAMMGLGADQIDEAYDYFNGNINFNLNDKFDARKIIGDNAEDFTDNNYGNNEVEGPKADHGTHVAGIIGANRANSKGVLGVANNVKLMVLRAVPDGDERDKDIAKAIRYAVDNGAQVVNMSFGKSLSPNKTWVDEAVKYAETKGVLLIHAAGNDGENTDTTANFPNKKYQNGGEASNWIEVGALSWKNGEESVATFSNFGKTAVDLFAPGVDLNSSVPNGKYKENSGTSMAAPVVSGVAALMLSYFPTLKTAELKDILMKSTVKLAKMVQLPGKPEEKTMFANLSVTGGVINAYNAVEMAMAMEKNIKIKPVVVKSTKKVIKKKK